MITLNPDQAAKIHEKILEHNTLITEYKEFIAMYQTTSEKKYLQEAIELYISKIMDTDKALLQNKYKYNFLETTEPDTIKLVQEKYNIYDLELIKNE